MSNILVTNALVAKEALAILQNMVSFAKNVNRDYESEFTGNQGRGYSPGQTINIKRPPRYTYRAGRVSLPQPTVETSIPITLQQGGTDINFLMLEKTLTLQNFEKKMMAACVAVVNEIDRQGLDMARRTTANLVGTPGSPPNSQAAALALLTNGGRILNEMATPQTDRLLVVNPAMNANILQGFTGMFNPAATNSAGFKQGMVQSMLGFDVAMDQNVSRHVNGTQAAGTLTVNGAGQSGSSLTVAATTGTITQGTVFVVAGTNAVNPQSRQDTGSQQQFVVTANVASGATVIPIFPAITASGAFQTVTASPANAAAITIVGAASAAYDANILFHRDAYTLAMVPMAEPMKNAGAQVTQMSDDGFTVKVTTGYDTVNDNQVTRLDVLFGWAAPYAELATKVVA